MKIAIVGGRDFFDYELLKESVFQNLSLDDIDCVVSGGAKGADSLGEKFAEEFNLDTLIFKPDWKKYGRSAGHIRNKDIIENADFVFAFWDGMSKGTKGSINIANKLNKTLKVILYAKPDTPQLF